MFRSPQRFPIRFSYSGPIETQVGRTQKSPINLIDIGYERREHQYNKSMTGYTMFEYDLMSAAELDDLSDAYYNQMQQ